MKSWKTILTLACAAFILDGTTAYGADPDPGTYRSYATGDWNNSGTWEVDDGGWRAADEYPQAGDTANVIDGDVVTLQQAEQCAVLYIDDGEVDTGAYVLTISASGGLTIDASELLDVSGSGGVALSGAGTHTVDGAIELDVADSDLTISGSGITTISGTGEIDGQNDAALISIPSDKTLISTLDTAGKGITGALQITGDGTFDNRGRVDADYNSGGNETLLVTVNTVDDSTTTADRWIVSANGAILKLDASIGTLGTLDGNFVMLSSSGAGAGSEIQIYHSLDTNGRLRMDVGTVRIDPDDAGGDDTVTMGDDAYWYMDKQGGTIEVAPGETFIHD